MQSVSVCPTSAPYDAMMVPEEAVNTDQDRKFLLVVDSKGIVKRCDVKLGRLLDNGMQVVLSSARRVAKDSQIITEGMQRENQLSRRADLAVFDSGIGRCNGALQAAIGDLARGFMMRSGLSVSMLVPNVQQ